MDWQTVVSLLIVGWAGWFLVRQLLRSASGNSVGGCHGCDQCPTQSAESQLIPLKDADEGV